MTECPACMQNPNSHSFTNFSTVGDIHYVYSSPAKSLDYKESDTNMQNFKKHLNTMKGKRWIWVFDCAHMEMKHYSSFDYMKKLATILVQDHSANLDAIYIVHPNSWMRTSIQLLQKLFSNSVCKKIHVLAGEKLELYVALEKAGVRGQPFIWLMQTFTA